MIYRRKGAETLVSPATLANGNRIEPVITRLASGGFATFWLDRTYSGSTETLTGRGGSSTRPGRRSGVRSTRARTPPRRSPTAAS